MERSSKAQRYQRIQQQLDEYFVKTRDPIARMATAAALVHHKMPGFSWTGFYLLREPSRPGEEPDLVVGPYQGPVACPWLPPHQGVCWAGIDRGEVVIVPDVHAFPGHIACDPRSRSEIVVPLRDGEGRIVGVLDVDSWKPAHFDEVDGQWLSQIVAKIYS
ncbi:MAG: GAF domain-containing protein [Thermoanaerobaculum sp.]|nr:GAF domain-containing protein [Thermoanaerobaculum sp.]MDW7968702.1 GAF domain-containing protein [Thermoanaerobaculum sp.]